MAMLAEKKQRTKWCLNPRGNTWANDSSKFGQRILEKMGWTPGKGLGVKEQGMKDILKVGYKSDAKGFGFQGQGEEWLKQQELFNNLLSELSSEMKSETNDSFTKTKSLEERSKLSKARVHYHKFTRGKDLSRYTEKDLSCITGVREDSYNKLKPVNGGGDDNNQKFIEKGDMYGYFQRKSILVSGKNCPLSESEPANANGLAEDIDGTDNAHSPSSLNLRQNGELPSLSVSENYANCEIKPKRKKKKRKAMEELCDHVPVEAVQTDGGDCQPLDDFDKCVIEEHDIDLRNKKQQSSNGSCYIHFEEREGEVEENSILEEPVKKKKKKKFDNNSSENIIYGSTESLKTNALEELKETNNVKNKEFKERITDSNHSFYSKKKKRSKSKQIQEDDFGFAMDLNLSKKKAKKTKKHKPHNEALEV